MASTESPCKDTPMEEDVEEIEDEDEEEEEEVEEEDEEIEEEEDEEEGDNSEVTVGRRSGRGLTLKTLLKERILEPGDGNMTINYLGNKFKGDLLPDGRIRSQETAKVFGTPSAWAIYCKKIVNPDKKSGCGWASVRYRGKKLDTYKNNWFRQKRLEYEKEEEMEEEDLSSESDNSPTEQEILEFELLGNRNPNHDTATMIELTSFQSIGRIQPFNITMSSSAMAVIDVHAHLTTSEIVGYLAGQWDVNNHNLIVSHALPARCRLGDKNGTMVEQELYAEMSRLKLSLVGWYHSHPFTPPLPTLRDVDSQLDYEMKMKGYNDASYTPVLGIIVSPYQKTPSFRGIPHPNGNATGFWVMPPPENKPLEYGKPMSMQFTVVQDAFIPKEALLHMSEVVKYYHESPDSVAFADYFEEKVTYWHKLKVSLQGRVPKDHFSPLIDFLRKIIESKLPEDEPLPLALNSAPTTSLPAPSVSVNTSASSSPIATSAINSAPPSIPSVSTVNPPPPPSSPITHPLVQTPDRDSRPSSQVSADIPTNYSKDKEIPHKSDFPIGIFPTSEALLRERESFAHPLFSHSPNSPSPSIPFSTPDKYTTDEERSLTSTPKVRDEKTTPPPKSFSPIFQHPPPPLFALDSTSKSKDVQPLPPIPFLSLDEKRPFELIQKSLASLRDGKAIPSSDVEPMSIEAIIRNAAKSANSSSKSNLLQNPPYVSSRESEGGFLDLSLGAAKSSEGNSSSRSKQDESGKEVEERPTGLAAWFAQQKYAQDMFSMPPHERDNPFLCDPQLLHRDLTSLVSSASGNFSLEGSQWNTGLNFAKDVTSSLPQKSSSGATTSTGGETSHHDAVANYSKKVSASPTPFSFSLDAQQPYHQEGTLRDQLEVTPQHGREKAFPQESPSLPTYMMEESTDQRDFRGSPHSFLSRRMRPDQSDNY